MSYLISVLAIIASAWLGYYITRFVLHLAQRRSVIEDASDEGLTVIPQDAAESQEAVAGWDSLEALSTTAQRNGQNRRNQEPQDYDGISGPDGIQAKDGLRGGMWIGLLERMLITSFVLSGQFAGVAVVIAIKGLGRYPELNAQTSERFIIGTLASLLWACVCGWIGLFALRHFGFPLW